MSRLSAFLYVFTVRVYIPMSALARRDGRVFFVILASVKVVLTECVLCQKNVNASMDIQVIIATSQSVYHLAFTGLPTLQTLVFVK